MFFSPCACGFSSAVSFMLTHVLQTVLPTNAVPVSSPACSKRVKNETPYLVTSMNGFANVRAKKPQQKQAFNYERRFHVPITGRTYSGVKIRNTTRATTNE